MCARGHLGPSSTGPTILNEILIRPVSTMPDSTGGRKSRVSSPRKAKTLKRRSIRQPTPKTARSRQPSLVVQASVVAVVARIVAWGRPSIAIKIGTAGFVLPVRESASRRRMTCLGRVSRHPRQRRPPADASRTAPGEHGLVEPRDHVARSVSTSALRRTVQLRRLSERPPGSIANVVLEIGARAREARGIVWSSATSKPSSDHQMCTEEHEVRLAVRGELPPRRSVQQSCSEPSRSICAVRG